MDERFGKLLALAMEETPSLEEATIAACMAYEMPVDAQLGLDAQGHWHGPQSPGPGWVQVGKGERGGLIWQKQGAAQTPTGGQWMNAVNQAATASQKAFANIQESSPANRASKAANAASANIGRGRTGNHQQAAQAHKEAAKQHQTAASYFIRKASASDPGSSSEETYQSLAFGHREAAQAHLQAALAHSKEAGSVRTDNPQPTAEQHAQALADAAAANPIIAENVQPPDARFALDIFDRKAQGVLNRAIEASRKLSAQARRDLKAALAKDNPDAILHAFVAFLDRYRVQLARLLSATQLTALLEGAREIARNLPVIPPQGLENLPPSLGPAEAVELLERVQGLTGLEREQAIYALPPEQQRYVRQGIDVNLNPPPPIQLPAPPAGSPEHVQWPVLDEALRSLSEKNVVTREQFDRLDAASRSKAFTITGIDQTDTIARFRNALAEAVRRGPDLKDFRKAVAADAETAGLLSDAHLELVYRNAIQTAFSDGQMRVLSHPFVRSGFPYAARYAIHDDRVRQNHEAMEKHGIQGTNVYRTDDPVWNRFRAPWADNCRCNDTFITIRQAAERGIDEAQTWLRTGIEPEQKAWVAMPDFAPAPRFDRLPTSMPLSVQLSVVPMEALAAVPGMDDERHETATTLEQPGGVPSLDKPQTQKAKLKKWKSRQRRRKKKTDWRKLSATLAIDAALGMVGDEWHGPQPPGPGWVQVGTGKRGGKVWKPQYRVQPSETISAQPGKVPTVVPSQKQQTVQPTQPPQRPAHPFSGKSIGEMQRAVNPSNPSATAAEWPNPNPLHYDTTKFPAGFDAVKVLPSIGTAIAQQQSRNAFQRLNLDQAFVAAKAAQPDLSLWDFQNAMAKLQADGMVRLGPYTQALATHPSPSALMPLDREWKWYVEAGSKPLPQGAAPAVNPIIQDALGDE